MYAYINLNISTDFQVIMHKILCPLENTYAYNDSKQCVAHMSSYVSVFNIDIKIEGTVHTNYGINFGEINCHAMRL